MEFQVLGRVSIARDGEVVCPSGTLARTLLGVLLSKAGTPVRVEALTEVLWPGMPLDRAAPKLHIHLSRLRTMLGDRERVRHEQGTYRLRVEQGELDGERFTALAVEAAELADADPARCVELSRKALVLWQGDPYPGIDAPTVVDDVARLHAGKLLALEALYRAELRLGRHAAILPELVEFAATHPLHELAHRLLITANYLGGRRTQAIAAYQTVRRRLLDELAVEPGPELRELERLIRAGAPIHASSI